MKLLRLPLLIPAALIALATRALWYFGVKVKFSNFLSSRIGHLVGNTEIYLCEIDAGMHEGTHIWTHYGEPANAQIDLMLRRVMRIWPQRLTTLAILLNKCFKGWEKHEIGVGTLDRDPRGLLAKYPPHLKFTPAERERGEDTLRQWGISEGAQWVCLMVRDGAYLPQLGYHSYRDCDVDTYEDAALMLANRGYYVFRMGATVAKPFAAKHPRIFDYATNGMRSDFMDVYLGAYCAFCVSTSTGWDAIPQAFRRPMCYTNFVPFEYLPTWLPNSLAIWKHHSKATLVKVKGRLVNNSWQAYTDSGKETSMGSMLSLADEDLTENDWKRMSVAELVASGAGKFMQADEFTRAGVSLQDNTPQEILDVVTEMADMMEGRARPEPQEEFWTAFPRSTDSVGGYPLHGEIRMRIGSKFLRGYDVERKTDTRSDSGESRVKTGTV